MAVQHVLISLMQPVTLLRNSFREYALSMIINRQCDKRHLENPLNYNCVPYMTALIKEIFSNHTTIGEIAPSTQLLIKDGMDWQSAAKLANQILTHTTDAISGYFPHLVFGGENPGYMFDFCGEFDLMVGIASKEEEVAWE